ncbi:hypothetical protein SAMN05216556_1111 [Aequorivita viscosa]|uniref:Membrane domain of glycerophosphoryl diester phosphodiesterase n=2 Tax=Aequorivita viscosa TaxID=797419 RepID=A0A1M6GLE3_9FLAO|nr:hypothetical protein SAMN05216556_1111 [Aequorivita viscosa]SHJ10779.1 hypothetical protein SAMN04487908_109114 [Aequorivita viscosa]
MNDYKIYGKNLQFICRESNNRGSNRQTSFSISISISISFSFSLVLHPLQNQSYSQTMNEFIHFKQQRELGTILTDIFKFIRLNWKSLFGLILKVAGPALLILVAAYIYYMQAIFGTSGILQNLDAIDTFSGASMLSVFFLFLAAIIYYSLLNGVILHYIKAYIENKGNVTNEAVTDGVREDFWKLLAASFLVAIITGFGMMFCLIPGIYVGVVLSTTYAVIVFEKRDVLDTISYCFKLIKNEWWMTFATLFVVFLLYYFINFIFQIPQYVYFFIKGFSISEEIAADPAVMFDWIYTALTSIALLFQYLMYSIIVLCSAFIYFNLNEKKNFTGTMETIDSIGERED